MTLELHSSFIELLKDLFYEPFVQDLCDKFKNKTYINRELVRCLLTEATSIQINTSRVKYILNYSYLKLDDVFKEMENIWKVFNKKVNFSKFTYDPDTFSWNNAFYRESREIINQVIQEYYGDLDLNNYQHIGSFNYSSLRKVKKAIIHALENSYQYTNNTNCSLSQLAQLLANVHEYPKKNRTGTDDFTNINLSESYLDVEFKFGMRDYSGSNFSNCVIYGKNSTDYCNHGKMTGCNFTNARFTGEARCTKCSNWDNCNFTNCDMTGLTCNTGEMSMKNCNFTDAYLIKDGKKLMGRALIKYWMNDKNMNLGDFHYSSPKDGGYNPGKKPDPDIWKKVNTDNDTDTDQGKLKKQKTKEKLQKLIEEASGENLEKIKKIMEVLQ